jgi:hypothetical protein
MSRSYWRALLAIVGLTLLGVGLAVTYQLYEASEQQQAKYSYQPARHPSFPDSVAGKPPPQPYQPSCNNPQKYENADLCAQWAAVSQVVESNRMASLNLRLAIFSLWATAIATVLLIWTLIETRETSRRELRAYIFVDACGLIIGDKPHNRGKVISIVVVKNSGSTPAHRVLHWSNVVLAPASEENFEVPDSLDEQHAATIPPGGGITADRLTDKVTVKQAVEIRNGTKAIFVYGAIEYLDVFDRPHRTNYRLYYSGIWPPPENNNLRLCIVGNDAN